MPKKRKFTDEQVIAARREYALGKMYLSEFKKRTVRTIARKLGTSVGTVHDMLHYRTYHDVFEDLHEVPELKDWLLDNEDEHWKRNPADET